MPSARDISVFSDDPSYLGRVLRALPGGSGEERFNRVGWPEVKKMLGEEKETFVGARRRKTGEGLPGNVLVLAAASELPQLASFLHSANSRHHLRALLVRDDEPEWIPQLLSRANVRALRNMLVTREGDVEVPRRVLSAWALGAPGEMIADARLVEEGAGCLLVVSCAMDQIECAFEDVPALAQMPEEERSQFEVAAGGSYLRWPASDVDLDLDALRYHTDEGHRRRADRERLTRDEAFGAAVAAVRERHELRQADVEGLSARQVRRIEKGESRASTDALEKLAEAHGLRANDYLEEVAEALQPDS